MRAANATQSAADTPQLLAKISTLLASNSLLPNFTVGMEHAAAAVRLTLRPKKCGGVESHLVIALYFSLVVVFRFATHVVTGGGLKIATSSIAILKHSQKLSRAAAAESVTLLPLLLLRRCSCYSD
jgi:hypothetical protein